ncbi:hypothetical protein HK404_23580 [Myxococcus xanthus]|nr:hypothetical protein [Myxococcus xanthus]QVW64798.1 hypothetical protein JTM82_20315 [Myxococcus xanthus DZ2]NOK04390.1 hypothetical protein [Myxococcus xanthus]QPM82493.1 hypothetical protein I5Q59_14970 [Myxococcus xanthus]QQR47259.1 hypothetical protein JKA73_14855 [Myxococcus xanthus]
MPCQGLAAAGTAKVRTARTVRMRIRLLPAGTGGQGSSNPLCPTEVSAGHSTTRRLAPSGGLCYSGFMRVPGIRILSLLVLAAAGAAGGADFVGPDSCKGCHPEAYDAWMQSKHARAESSLTDQQKKDGRCLSCHSPEQVTQATVNVTCETCHGGGQYYSPEYVMKDSELARLVGLVDPSEKQCRSCHDASSPSLRPFDFKESLKAIDHWSAERARRAADPSAKK